MTAWVLEPGGLVDEAAMGERGEIAWARSHSDNSWHGLTLCRPPNPPQPAALAAASLPCIMRSAVDRVASYR